MVLTTQQKRELDKQIIDKAKRDARNQTLRKGFKTARRVSKESERIAKKSFKGISRAFSYRPTSQRQGQAKKPVGRPRGDFKHRDPFTGQPIPATVYYKRVKEFKRLQQQKASQVDQAQIAQLAKRGIPPQLAQQIVNQRQIQSVMPNQVQVKQVNPYNQQLNPQQQIQQGRVILRGTPVWKFRRGVVGKDAGLFGPRQVVFGLPESFWN